MNTHHFAIKDALKWGFKTFLHHILFFLGIILVTALLVTGLYVSVILVVAIDVRGYACSTAFSVLMYLLGTLVAMLLKLGFIKIQLDLYDKGTASLLTLISQTHILLTGWVIDMLLILLISLGLGLFIVPGIYLYCRFFFIDYVLVDEACGIAEAFEKSSRLTEGARWTILGFALLSWCINLIPFMMIGTSLAKVYAYRKQLQNEVLF